MTHQTAKQLTISIIIPALNEASTIEEHLQALQKHRPQAEIIVVDGGSHDTTTQIANAYADQVISADAGRAKQMNTGALHAQGAIFLFLHADTLLPDDALTLIQQAITPQQQWGRFNVRLKGQHAFLKIIAYFMNGRSRLTGIATGDQGIFVSRSAFTAVNQYTNQALMEDIDLCKKLKRISAPACLTATVISSARRWEQFGVFKTLLLMWSLRLRYFLGESPDTLAQLYREGVFWKH
ncbi:MAG: TIGR04283 family arsenosugar biosynthesis glycosyltransferase [Methylococcales bacterium]|nr:TIGR04283 family arsenosugar biosynthesis glycosyltransferase [Methylococcales bacterium]